jgi:hypothetical protein
MSKGKGVGTKKEAASRSNKRRVKHKLQGGNGRFA